MAMLRARGGRSVTTLPSITMSPEVGRSSPAIMRIKRGLAASGWAEQNQKFAFLRGQVDAVDRAHLIEILGNRRASTVAMRLSIAVRPPTCHQTGCLDHG